MKLNFLKKKNSKNILFPYYVCSKLCVICLVASRKWTSLVKPNPVSYMYFVAKHMTESLLLNFITQCFHRRWFGAEKSITQISWVVSYFEDEKWRYASWEMMWFTAFSFRYTATFVQTWIHATCLKSYQDLSKQTTRQLSISFVITD